MKIGVIGSNYAAVGDAVVLMEHNDVKLVRSAEIEERLVEAALDHGSDVRELYSDDLSDIEIAFISVPVIYDPEINLYDLQDLERNISRAVSESDALIVIRSEVPVGYTRRACSKFNTDRLVFCPDFSREGSFIIDKLDPGRVIVGEKSERAELVADLIKGDSCAETVLMDSAEAESVKLFANAYLAMRVAFFNELDTYAELRGMNTRQIIDGISSDRRIGDKYNNPSFGYGGMYLYEAGRKLKSNFAGIPERIMDTVDASNEIRKKHISEQILEMKPEVVGIYKMSITSSTKDFRYSPVLGIIERLQASGVKVVIHEPMLFTERYRSAEIVNDLEKFKSMCDVIVANRIDGGLEDVMDKVYSRDIFKRD